MKKISFRFDIDTHKCLTKGVPNILSLGDKYNVKFTFFVNCGRSIDLKEQLLKLMTNKRQGNVYMLSAFRKLGAIDYVRLLLTNPQIKDYGRDSLKMIYKKGHEVGLHGGKNHDIWQSNALCWSDKELKNEIMWGLAQLRKIDKKNRVYGFSSPAWVHPDKLLEILRELNFVYSADRHTNKPFLKISKKEGIYEVPTNIVGEPGGVGYVENKVALGKNDNEIVKDFGKVLRGKNNNLVVYDHPYFIGVEKIILLEQLIKLAIEAGFNIVPMKKLI